MTDPAITGTIYGTLLNGRAAFAALSERMRADPYKAPPSAPILYIKPRNTWAGPGDRLVVPPGEAGLRIDATIGLVFGRDARRVSPERALDHLSGFAIICDATLPNDLYYRPAIRQRCRDGYCPIGPIAPAGSIADPAALVVRTLVDGVQRASFSLAELVRPLPQLVADVSEFLTLSAGDVLLVGAAADAPVVRAGETVRIEVDDIGALANPVSAEAGA